MQSKRNFFSVTRTFLTFVLLISLVLTIGCKEEEPRNKSMPISVLIKRMIESDREQSIEKSMESIIEIGAPGVPYLIKAWKKNDNTETRRKLCVIFDAIGPDAASAAPLLIEELNAFEETRVNWAAFALGGIGGEAAAPAIDKLGSLLRSSDTSTQKNILYALGGIGQAADSQIPLILKALERSGTRNEAVIALGKLGPKAVEAIKVWLVEGTTEQRQIACNVLAGSNDITIVLTDLAVALKDDEASIRISAAHAISKAGPRALPVQKDLLEALSDRDKEVRRNVIEALAAIGPDNGQPLIDALKSRNSNVKEGAAKVIGRYSSLILLGKDELVKHMSDSNVKVRLAVSDALARAGAEIVPTMIRQLKSSNASRKSSAARILGNIGKDAEAAIPELQKLLRSNDSVVKEEARKAIAKIRR